MQSNNPIVLSPTQQNAVNLAKEWFNSYKEGSVARSFFVLAGYAGTGKTTCINAMIEQLEQEQGKKLQVAFMAYTGKAASVIAKYNKVPATTIHSRIYFLRDADQTVLSDLSARIDAATDEKEKERLREELTIAQRPRFELRPIRDYETNELTIPEDIIILDECSMVNEELLSDLLYFEVPIIALGDPGQLPPVSGEGAIFKDPADVTLTEVRRQAAENPIIQWSMKVRDRKPLPTDIFTPDDIFKDKATKFGIRQISTQQLMHLMEKHDITLVWKNKTRQFLNQAWRQYAGFAASDPVWPVAGDTLICTKNDRELGIFNGQFTLVKEIISVTDIYIEMRVVMENTSHPIIVKVLRACFEVYEDPDAFRKLAAWMHRNTQQFDFGYALTCHKSQGSQWERVLLWDEKVLAWPGKEKERAQWLYTGITRAAEYLTILC